MMSSGVSRTPISAMSSPMNERSSGRPSELPYCRAIEPWCATASCAARAASSVGISPISGIPPAKEMTSEREAAANRSRTAEERTCSIRSE
jgi:hypothetical protein